MLIIHNAAAGSAYGGRNAVVYGTDLERFDLSISTTHAANFPLTTADINPENQVN